MRKESEVGGEVNQHDMSRNSPHKLSPHIGGWRLGETRLKLKFPSRLIDKLSRWPEVSLPPSNITVYLTVLVNSSC